jgi:putative FmdB family regulatory protein
MPVYEFACKSNTCPTYEIWRAIDKRSTATNCPQCGGQGQRLYNPIASLTSSLRLKVERKEPELVRKPVNQSSLPKASLRESGTRPWMLNRGC